MAKICKWLKNNFTHRYNIGRNESVRTPKPLTQKQIEEAHKWIEEYAKTSEWKQNKRMESE